ncbi:MAG: glycosyltransferase [Candidatus Latescibacteria bacterium]|nr:glycosyltransferase [bacterium]MBD3424550.1 glycosyltransferase [Candidatus Latescibacterota bacterium]
MDKLKILAINWRDMENPEAGGAEVHLHEILKHLGGWGHEVAQISARFRGGEREKEIDGVRVMRTGHWFDANFSLPLFARKHLQSTRYDVILEDINKIPFFMPLYTGIPVLPVIPHLFGTTVFRETNRLIGSYVVLAEKLIPRVFKDSRFMVISPSTREDLAARGIDRDRISVVLCGLDHDRFYHAGLDRFEEPTVVHLGRLRKYKGVEIALRAVKIAREKIENLRFVIIGDGPYREELERKVSELELEDTVRFKGYIDFDELVDYLNRAHLLVNPSPKEGWGLTVVEANACGMPVVASDSPGLRDSVIHGETGFLVPHGDETSFADRIIELIEDGRTWQKLSRGGIERVRSLTWERCARETETVIREFLAGRRS